MTQNDVHDMSEDEPASVSDAPDPRPDDDLEERVVEVPADDGKQPMTLRELRKAVEDESHPRHAEAVQRNKELAEQLKPAVERLRQTVMQQSGPNESLARIQETLTKTATISVPRVNLQKFNISRFDMPDVDFTTPATEQQFPTPLIEQQKEIEQAIDAIVEARAKRQRLEDQRAKQTLDVFVAMEAHMAQLNDRIGSVDAKIEAGNVSSSKVARWTVLVAVLTFFATVTGIVMTVLLSP